jgi:hypothetical protein
VRLRGGIAFALWVVQEVIEVDGILKGATKFAKGGKPSQSSEK